MIKFDFLRPYVRIVFAIIALLCGFCVYSQKTWIRINQLGYTPNGIKVAVWCSKEKSIPANWQLIDVKTKKTVLSAKTNPGNAFGTYGPFEQTYRLNFTAYNKPGRYYLQAGDVKSPEFEIGKDVYKGAADFCLRYMRQQRTGFNPFLKDSCHTHDGYVLYGQKAGIPDSAYFDVVGGWHDASDYLQYVTTSANATYHLLLAYRDFRQVFTDEKLANGLNGKNGLADVMDEAKWGIDWLLKMFPGRNIMFNQIADDRDHMGMRIPAQDTFYGSGYQRPVYFVSGEPQQRGKFMNNTTGTSSTAGKMASVFALTEIIRFKDEAFRKADKRGTYYDKAFDALNYAVKKPGVTQTASVQSPYIYAEDNWVDDMELAMISIHSMLIETKGHNANGSYLMGAVGYSDKEKITPWLGSDTAKHYQWYPFINLGHNEVARHLKTRENGPYTNYTKKRIDDMWNKADSITNYYRQGILAVWNKASKNAFYRGIPFIWCSNNLAVSFAIQCYWYRQLTGDKKFSELEQANFDWLFGCNPWGASMVYGLPSWGDTPADPHSAFTHLKNYPIDGGLVDGPVYTSIYKNLIGIQLYQPDEYEMFQSNLAVYHDDYGDYSTNEPTMDGTASLIYLLAAKEAEATPIDRRSFSEGDSKYKKFSYSHGGIIRADSTQKKLALIFTGDEFADGGNFIANTLKQQKVKASFFLTGKFYYADSNQALINKLAQDGHFLSNHSFGHLLYCDWNNRDSLLVTKEEFLEDLMPLRLKLDRIARNNTGSKMSRAKDYFLPPYEWYNDSITTWTNEQGIQLINFTPGTRSNADYTWPELKNYQSSEAIYKSIIDYEKNKPSGLNGFLLLLHVGTDPRRTDKFYKKLPQLLTYLKSKGYKLETVDELLQ